MSKTICIYHKKDLDGKASGAIVKLKYPEVQLIGWDYGDPIPVIEPGNDIIVVDICLETKLTTNEDKFEPMNHLAEISNSMIWIDHHKSSIEKYEKSDSPFKNDIICVLQIGKAGCELAWDYFFGQEPMPKMIELLGEYDTWRNEDHIRWEKVTMPFQFGMRVQHTSVDDVLNLLKSECRICRWCGSDQTLWAGEQYRCKSCGQGFNTFNVSKTIDGIVHDGKTVLQYQSRQNTNAMRFQSYELEFDGYKAIVCNNPMFNSQLFYGFYDEAKHDIMICWIFDGKLFKYSLYSTKDDVDVSKIAVAHGGGGHKGAAGFENEKYIL